MKLLGLGAKKGAVVMDMPKQAVGEPKWQRTAPRESGPCRRTKWNGARVRVDTQRWP